MEKRFNYVYITTNVINGKQYIGDRSCNIDPEKDAYIGSGIYFKHALNQYGRENFKREIIEFFQTKSEAFFAQEKYINYYNTLTPKGYNISPTGGVWHLGGGNHSDETKLKIKNTLTGSKHTPDRIQKMANSKRGYKYSEERCEKQRQSMKGKNLGKIMSEEQKHNLKIINTGKIHSSETKKKMSVSHTGITFSETHLYNIKLSAKNRPKVICKYCNKEMNTAMHNRWHGENCKYKN